MPKQGKLIWRILIGKNLKERLSRGNAFHLIIWKYLILGLVDMGMRKNY